MAVQRELLQLSHKTLSHENPWLTATGSQIQAHWIEQMRAQPDSSFFVFDMDDTLTETLLRWVKFMVRTIYGGKDLASHLDRILQSNNPFGLLRKEFGDEKFTELEQYLRFSRWGNSYGKPVDPAIPELLAHVLERDGNVLGVLTARPDTPEVIQHTHSWIQQQELLADLPLYHAPAALNHAQTQVWKVDDVLGNVRKATDNSPLMLIDDSVSTAARVEQWNRDHTDYLPIIQILLETSLTQVAIAEKYPALQKGQSFGVFVAKNWSQIPAEVHKARVWFEDVKNSRTNHGGRNSPVR